MSASEKKMIVKAFKIRSADGWMPQHTGADESAACVLICEGGHSLSVNDAWASVYEPQAGGWLLVNQMGRAAYRSNEDFHAGAVHVESDFYSVPLEGDILEHIKQLT